MAVLEDEADLAARRVREHWQKVREKQLLYRKLQRELEKLNTDLEELRREETSARDMFDAALQRLFDRKKIVYDHRHKGLPSSVRRSLPILCAEYDEMEQDVHSNNPSSYEGKKLRAAESAVSSKESDVELKVNELARAKKPPPALYQPLPDSREGDYEALAVLFYARSDLAGNMPLLQQFCCAAQLAVCPWPLERPPLWSVGSTVSPQQLREDINIPWNRHFFGASEGCKYLSRSPASASIDASSDVHIIANFKVPEDLSLIHISEPTRPY